METLGINMQHTEAILPRVGLLTVVQLNFSWAALLVMWQRGGSELVLLINLLSGAIRSQGLGMEDMLMHIHDMYVELTY